MPLRNGRVWLTSRDDMLTAQVMRGLEELLARRAADRVSDERLLAEAVGVLGAEVARVRGELPARGATEALDQYLRAPSLDQSRRTEAESMLRVALSAAADDPEVAARLDRLPGSSRPVSFSGIVSASAEISRDAQLLGVTPPPTTSSANRHRAQAGSSHRRAEGRRVWTGQIRGTGLITGSRGRPSADGALTSSTALDALASMSNPDLANASVTEPPAIDLQAQQAIFRTTVSDVPQHVRVQVGPTTLGALAHGIIRAGTAEDPHVLEISSEVADAQLRHVWTHQLAQMTQEIAAAQADRPRGVLGRLKSAFGHERRDRRLSADHAAFQVMVQDWHQARAETMAIGRPTGPRTVEDLERDLSGLAKTIRRHGGAEPTLPWAPEAMSGTDAAAFGIAAARAAEKPARHTPAHLRGQVVTQIQSLESAVKELEKQAATKKRTAGTAEEEADKTADAADTEEQGLDLGASERARILRKTATSLRNKADRHIEIRDAYAAAAAKAKLALDSYQELLTEIDAGSPQDQLTALAGAAQQQVDVYEHSRDAAMPVKDLLMTGVPEGQPVRLPADDINRVLAANGIRHGLPTRGPQPFPSAEYRRLLSQDGMVFALGGDPDGSIDDMPEVRMRMRPRNLRERTDHDFEMAEQMSGTLGEGGTSVATTNTHSTSSTVGVNLQPLLALAAPGTPLHVAAQLVSPKVEATRGRTLANTGGATAHHQHGWVDDNRGESLLCEWDGVLEVEVRRSPTEPWSPVESIDVGRQQTWVSSAYTVKPPAETVTLAELGHAKDVTSEFPRHAVTSISGVQEVTDRLIRRAQQQYGGLDRGTYNHIAGLMVYDSHRLLREMSQPGGITRRFRSTDNSEYELTWEVEPVWSNAELIGESSSEMWQEEVLVDFAGVNASQVYGASATGTGSLAYPGVPVAGHPAAGSTTLKDIGGSGVNVGPSVSAGRTVTRQGGQNVSMTTISPAVHRNQGPTQGVMVGLKVKATLQKVGDTKNAPIVERDLCKALLRVAENDLLRVGGRADKDAVLRNPDDSLQLDKSGRVLLRGDATPSTGPQTVPPWMGRGENQLRGAGKALPQNLIGADDAQRDALVKLSEMGLVPAVDDHGLLIPGQPATTAQLNNYQRVMQQISAPRLEAGIDQACQGGLIVMLEDHGFAGTPRWRPFRLSVTQDHDETTGAFKAEGLGTSTNENLVLLGIASSGTGMTTTRSKSVPLSAGVDATIGPPKGIRGWMGRLGVKFSRNALGRTYSWSAGRRVSEVTLTDSTEPLDRFKQDIRIKFAEITDHGDETLADVRGSMELAYESSLARAGTPVFEQDPKAPDQLAVQQAFPVAVDAGNAADELAAAIPAIRSDSTAFPALHAALAPTSLIANRDWMNGSYRLPFTVVKAPGNPLHAFRDGTILPQEYQIVIRGEAVSLTHLAMTQQNSVDINFTMTDVGYTSGTTKGGGVTGSGGGGQVAADGANRSGGVSVGRIGTSTQSSTVSETSGDERLLINPGTHHEFLERHRMVADIVHNGQVIRSVPLPDAVAQKTMAERRALELYASNKLDLPLWVASDAAERYLNDKLDLDARVALGFVRRYQRETAGVTTGLAPTHTPERLAAKLYQRAEAEPAQDQTADERFTAAMNLTEAVAQARRVMHTGTEAYDESLGAAQIESLTVEGHPDQRVDLRALVEPQVDEVAPGLRDASLLLQNALEVDLTPSRLQGHLEDMLSVSEFEAPIEVPIKGQARPDVLFVRAWARYEGDLIVTAVPTDEDGNVLVDKDGKLKLPTENAGGVDQDYDYQQLDQSAGHTVAVTAGLDGKTPGPLGSELTGGLSTDLTTTDSRTEGLQNTNLRRLGHFKKTRIQRTVVFTTEVVRVRNAGAAAMASARWKLGRIDPADITSVSQRRELRAELSVLVPTDELQDGARTVAPQVQQEFETRPEHRNIQIPEGAKVLRSVPHGRGERKRDQLYENLTAYLRRPDVLGVRGTAAYRHVIRPMLKASALKAKVGRLLDGGVDLPPMAPPGNGNTMISVHVEARAVGWELDGDSLPGQEGHVWREQFRYGTGSARNRRTPLKATGGFDAGVASVSASMGEQVNEQSSDANGTRFEGSRFLEGQMVTVRIPLVYDATVRTTTDNGRGEPVTKSTTRLPELAHGEMFVRMLGHRYLEGLRQMEQGATMDAVLANSRLQAVPEKLGRPDVVATEYGRDESGAAVYQPYRPLLDAINRAKAERKPIVLLVREADGTERKYQALPPQKDRPATLLGVADGGFASEFATLHPNLVMMAEGRVNLRELYNTSSPEGPFSAKVAAELEKSGVPRDVLKAFDYTTAKATMAPAPSQGARTSNGGAAGRTIAPTGHGPSLTGP
ncbi:hypothetical protein [Kribbella kalugense]|uniref:hypothetical protein n=1 Tax=Kribbella kalugense TaxID=2512221 RepID=UPI001066EA2F|nr:hypothetical protein [Kribbella kalugense]